MDLVLVLFTAIVLVLIISFVLMLAFAFFILYEVHKLPDNTPAKYLSEREKFGWSEGKRVVCIGDSITHGRISQNYVQILREKLGDEYEIINAGLNSHLAWNVLERLDEIIECGPEIITILIGTNDVNATISLKNKRDYIKRMNLPSDPNHEWFCQTLKKIIQRLKTETKAQIAVLTLPMIGESLENSFFNLTKEYSKSIVEIAKNMEVNVLDLHETMVRYLETNPGKPTYTYEKERMYIFSSVIQHYFFLRSWDHIATHAGFMLHRDYLHMNTEGAIIIAGLIENYIHSVS
ncbi:MAG: SGNH/GDSL hydrolase family protein [Candidatus Hodarchaeales archaeon]|jgi:lysophospholipase L1-like esterase